MITGTCLRRASPSDVDAIAPLFDDYRSFYGRPIEPGASSFLRLRLLDGDAVVMIAEADGRAVGFALAYPTFESVSLARVYVLNDLYVIPAKRRGGVGRSLIEAIIAEAREAGASRLSLLTGADNVSAQHLYERLGWERDVRFVRYRRSAVDAGTSRLAT